ncbi:MAG: hypothetical protein PVJ39_04850 [Gammaproteobacteria bacterium]|jgi:hypothetical protein
MATFANIKKVRLAIDDPPGFVDLISVATSSTLPASPKHQTAYYVVDDDEYRATDVTVVATPADYEVLDLRVSDERIGDWIDSDGVYDARVYALRDITRKLGQELALVRTQSGAESNEYNALLDTYKYYKGLISDAEKEAQVESLNSSGRLLSTTAPEIAGGNL